MKSITSPGNGPSALEGQEYLSHVLSHRNVAAAFLEHHDHVLSGFALQIEGDAEATDLDRVVEVESFPGAMDAGLLIGFGQLDFARWCAILVHDVQQLQDEVISWISMWSIVYELMLNLLLSLMRSHHDHALCCHNPLRVRQWQDQGCKVWIGHQAKAYRFGHFKENVLMHLA